MVNSCTDYKNDTQYSLILHCFTNIYQVYSLLFIWCVVHVHVVIIVIILQMLMNDCRYHHKLIFSSAHSGNGIVLMNGKQDNCILKISQGSELLGSELCELPALILILLSGSCDHSQL